MQRINEIKSIMRQLKESKNESLFATSSVNEEADNNTSTENDTSEDDLLLARLEDIITRLEKALVNLDVEGKEEDDDNSDTPAEDEETEEAPADDEESEDEEPAEDEEPEEEPAEESLERRIANLERRFTESRRRSLCRRFTR